MKIYEATFKGISIITMILSWLVVIILLFLQFFDFHIIEAQPFLVKNRVVKKGDAVMYYQKFCKNYDFPARVRVYIADGAYYMVDEYQSNASTGCHEGWIAKQIPTTLLPGTYRIENRFTYLVSPFRQIEVQTISETFEIIE